LLSIHLFSFICRLTIENFLYFRFIVGSLALLMYVTLLPYPVHASLDKGHFSAGNGISMHSLLSAHPSGPVSNKQAKHFPPTFPLNSIKCQESKGKLFSVATKPLIIQVASGISSRHLRLLIRRIGACQVSK